MTPKLLVCAVGMFIAVELATAQIKFSDPLVDSVNAEIERRLDQKRDMLFNDATLGDVAKFLTSCGIPAYVDQRALDTVGIDVESPISIEQLAIRLRDGLTLALRPLDLSWMVRSGRLIITTPEEEEADLISRIYDVRNLVELVPFPWWGASSPNGNSTTMLYQYDFDSLLNMITSSIAPESWDGVGGPGSIESYATRRMRVIVVSQTYEVHRQLLALLDDLAAFGGLEPLPGPNGLSTQLPRSNLSLRNEAARRVRALVRIRSSQLKSTGW